jgi:5'-methylthioadenosine phosphorylase
LRIGIIGGTGVCDAVSLTDARDVTVKTPYGDALMKQGKIAGVEVLLVPRHGEGHTIPPHRVNYRANIWALWWMGAERVMGTAASGSLNSAMLPGDLVAVDQFIDFTKCRPATFFEGSKAGVVHTDMTDPYCAEVRKALIDSSESLGLRVHRSGCYVCTDGPRFETRAEIRAFSVLGGDLVGMTNVPEVVLAREAGMCYGLLGIVTNFAAGIARRELSHEEVVQVMAETSGRVAEVLCRAAGRLVAAAGCGCRRNWSRLAELRGVGAGK